MQELLKDIEDLTQIFGKISDNNIVGSQIQLMQLIALKEAEFTKLNVVQRKALADSVGVNVEELSRLVRNQATGEGSRQVRNAVENFNKTTAENTNKLVLIGLGQKDAINKMKDELAQDR